MSCAIDKALGNKESYSTPSSVEKYSSHYALFPIEKALITKYFKTGSRVLDLACGAGRTTLILHELGYRVTGIDLSDALIGVAKRRFPYVDFRTGNFVSTGVEDSSIDNILISHNGLDYAYPEKERIAALVECARALKAGGILIYSSHNIRSFLASPYYLLNPKRIVWAIRNMPALFKSMAYVYDMGHYTYFSSPGHIVRQTERAGFRLVEISGFVLSGIASIDNFISPYIHYVFYRQRPGVL